MKEFFEKLWQSVTAYPQSFDDYYPIGRWLVYKKLLVLLAAAAVVALAILGWLALRPEKPYEIPVFFEGEDRLTAYSGEAVIVDSKKRVLYRGQVAAGLRSGQGRQYTPADGTLIYEGGFAQDVYSGQGTLYQAEIPLYEGGFADGAYSGTGTLYAGDTLLYRGEFLNGGYSGRGILYQKGQPIYEGEFLNGLYDGQGALNDQNGAAAYSGGFARGLYEGEGTLYAPDGAIVYEGGFSEGLYNGHGRLYTLDGGRFQFEGIFRKGIPALSGNLYNARGQKLFSGEMFDGRVDYAALLGLPVQELEKRVLETPVIYYGNGYAGYLYRELSFAAVIRYDYTAFKETQTEAQGAPDGESAQEQADVPPDQLTADLLLVDGAQILDRVPQEGVAVTEKALAGFEAFMASRLAGVKDVAALSRFEAVVQKRGAHLYEALTLPREVPVKMQGVFSGGVYYFYNAEELEKGGIAQVVFCRKAGYGG